MLSLQFKRWLMIYPQVKGPIITNEGAVISGGVTLNDGDLWGMNYYVQGVIGKVPN